jgi:hypothetical protein
MNYIRDNEISDISIILPKPPPSNITEPITILNTIVQHPYIEHLAHTTNNLTHLIGQSEVKILLYRINHVNGHHYVDYYIPNTRLLTIPGFKDSSDTNNYPSKEYTFIGYLKTHLADIPGTKRYKGYLIHNTEPYIVVQTRDNHNVDGWCVLWDVLANKQIYGLRYDSSLMEFFTKHHKLSELYINDTMCILPSVLYCQVPESNIDYVRKYRSCQYVQREITPLIKLHRFSLDDNVRNLCFITDTDITNTYLDIETNDYIILDEYNTITYIFKHDADIISFVK